MIRNGNEVVMEYKGYKYRPMDEIEEDNRKVFHHVETPEGELIWLTYSPYSAPSRKCFEMWIDMGLPKRGDEWVTNTLGHSGNFRDEDIEKLWKRNSIRYIKGLV